MLGPGLQARLERGLLDAEVDHRLGDVGRLGVVEQLERGALVLGQAAGAISTRLDVAPTCARTALSSSRRSSSAPSWSRSSGGVVARRPSR